MYSISLFIFLFLIPLNFFAAHPRSQIDPNAPVTVAINNSQLKESLTPFEVPYGALQHLSAVAYSVEDTNNTQALFNVDSGNPASLRAMRCIIMLAHKLYRVHNDPEKIKHTWVEERDMFEYIRLASKFGATEKLQTALTKVATAQIVDQFEPYFLNVKTQLPGDAERKAVEDSFLLALSHLAPEQKLEKQKAWYPLQYKSKEFKELSKTVHKLGDECDANIRSQMSGVYIDRSFYYFEDENIKKKLETWENSLDRRIYKKLAGNSYKLIDFSERHIDAYITFKKERKTAFFKGEVQVNFPQKMLFLHIPLLALLVRMKANRGYVRWDSGYGYAICWMEHSGDKLLYDVDIEHFGSMGRLFKKNTLNIHLDQDATIPWQSLSSLSNGNHEAENSKYVFNITHPNIKGCPSFHVAMPASYCAMIFKTFFSLLPFLWHKMNPLFLTLLRSKGTALDLAYTNKLNQINDSIPDAVKIVGSFLLKQDRITLEKKDSMLPLSLPEGIQWPAYTGDGSELTIGQLEEAQKALKSLGAVRWGWASYWNIGLYSVSILGGPKIAMGLVLLSYLYRFAKLASRKFQQIKTPQMSSSSHNYRYLNESDEPRPYAWRDVFMATLFGHRELAYIQFGLRYFVTPH